MSTELGIGAIVTYVIPAGDCAVKVDHGLRKPGAIVNRNMDAQMFAHRSCVPLDQVEFKHERQLNMFTTECEGMCGV